MSELNKVLKSSQDAMEAEVDQLLQSMKDAKEQRIAQLKKELAEALQDGRRDYDSMRQFQARFIQAAQERDTLREHDKRSRELLQWAFSELPKSKGADYPLVNFMRYKQKLTEIRQHLKETK